MTLQFQDSLDLQRIRSDFAFLRVQHPSGLPIAYLDNGASTQHPRQVLEAMQDCYEQAYSNVHRGVHFLSEAATERYEAARVKLANFVNTSNPDQIIFTAGCTAAINLVAHGWGRKFIKPGDVVLTTQMEHHANIVPWFQLRNATGCDVQFVKVTNNGLIDEEDFAAKLELRPKLLALTAVSNVLGTINPIKRMIRQAHDAGAKVLIDAAQAAPHHTLDVTDLNCDFLAFSGHKMLGPSGIGVLYAKLELLDAMDPFLGGGGMIDIVSEQGFTPGMVPSKFEAGTPPIVEAVGLAAAVDYLDKLGMSTIEAHERQLTEMAYQHLSDIDGVHILGPSIENRAGILAFTMRDAHAHDIAQLLDARGIAVRPGHHCTMPLHDRLGIVASARATFYIYNTVEEVERLIDAVVMVKEKFTSRGRHR